MMSKNPADFSFSNIEERLEKDGQGHILRQAVSGIKQEVMRLDHGLRRGADRKTFEDAQAYLAALGAAEMVITKHWRQLHRK